MTEQSWRVLLIGGQSATGKSRAAAEISRRMGVSWLQVDDFRLALQRTAGCPPALSFFLQPNIWQLPPVELAEALIGVGRGLEPGLEAVIENHVAQHQPLIIEGDGILPSLVARPAVQEMRAQIRCVFVVEDDPEQLLANMRARGRGIGSLAAAEQVVEAETKRIFGNLLRAEAQSLRLPMIPSRPFNDLPARILTAAS